MLEKGTTDQIKEQMPIPRNIHWIIGHVTKRLNPNVLEQLEDYELIELSSSGNHRAFEHLVRRYQKLVYNVVYQMTRNHETASDMTQETFLKVYRALHSFDRSRSFKPWILRIARNSTLNALRSDRDRQSLDELLDCAPGIEPQANTDIEREIEVRFSQQRLTECLEHLPLRQKEVFILRYQHDLKYEDICEVTGLSLSSVKSLLFRARESLRKKMSSDAEVHERG